MVSQIVYQMIRETCTVKKTNGKKLVKCGSKQIWTN